MSIHDPRTYRATVAHVWSVAKTRRTGSEDERPGSPVVVWQKRILVRSVEIEGLALDQQPAADEELDMYFQDEV